MFGFGNKRAMEARAQHLGAVLEHVGVYDGELIHVPGGVSAMLTAENVLLRQAEEIEAYRDMVDGPTVEHLRHELEVAQRNLGYERQGRSADRITYAEALRVSGREKGELSLRLMAAERELNGVLDVLLVRGLVDPVEDGAAVDLVTVVSDAVDRLGGTPAAVADVEATQLAETRPLTLREQALAVITEIAQPDGSFDAADGFTRYSAMGEAAPSEDGWYWGFHGLADLGYYHDMHSTLGGRSCVWRPVVAERADG